MATGDPEIPDYYKKAMRRQESMVQGLDEQQRRQMAELQSRGISPKGKNALVRPIIQKKLAHQRLREQIASEVDAPPEYPLIREQLS